MTDVAEFNYAVEFCGDDGAGGNRLPCRLKLKQLTPRQRPSLLSKLEICCAMSIVRRDHPSLPEAKKAASSLQVMMLTPSELAKLRRSTQEADAYLAKAFKKSQGRSEEKARQRRPHVRHPRNRRRHHDRFHIDCVLRRGCIRSGNVDFRRDCGKGSRREKACGCLERCRSRSRPVLIAVSTRLKSSTIFFRFFDAAKAALPFPKPAAWLYDRAFFSF